MSNRREFLRVALVTGSGALIAPRIGLAAQTTGDEAVQARSFRVAIQGLSTALPGVVAVDPGSVTIAVQNASKDLEVEPRAYTYGSHEYGDLSITVQQGPGMVKLQEWADKAMKSGGAGSSSLRRDISIYLLARDKSTIVRTITAIGCYPVAIAEHQVKVGDVGALACNAGDHSTSSDVKAITFTLNVDRIEVV